MKNITFINAGAGSGKTFSLIEHLYSWVVDHNNNPKKVLLTTFNKAAAAEIRERAQSKLLSKQRFTEANQLQEAPIGTVHAVGYSFIKKYWYLLGISPEVREISENEKDIFFLQAIADVPSDDELDRLSHLNISFNFTNSMGHYQPDQWRKDVLKIMEEAQTNNIDLNDPASLNYSLNKVKEIYSGSVNSNSLPEIVRKCKAVMEGTVLGTIPYKKANEKIDQHVEKFGNNKTPTYSDICDFNTTYTDICKAYAAKKYDTTRSQIPEFDFTQIDVLRELIIEYTELVFDIARRAMESYKSFKIERGLVDFPDMEKYFLQLLDNELVQREVTETIDLVMVDEFQDSNPIQINIFIKLAELAKQSYWVGDPKQSIYGFRGTDPELIQNVIQEFTKPNDQRNLNIELLKMSWRSTPELVRFANAIFSQRMQDQVQDIPLKDRMAINGDEDNNEFTAWREAVSISPLKAADTIALIPARKTDMKFGGIQFWQAHQEGNNGFTMGNLEVLREQIVDKVSKMVFEQVEITCRETKKIRPIRLSDICILTGSNHQVSEIAKSFQDAGYAANAIVDGLSETIEFRILQDVATLFLDSNHALSIAELAMVYDANLDTQDIIAKRLKLVIPMLHAGSGKLSAEHYPQLNDWLKDAHHRKLVAALQHQSAYLSVSNLLQKVVNHFNLFLKMFGFSKSSVRQANLLRLVELAGDYESYAIRMNQGAGLSGFFAFVQANPKKDVQAGTSEDAVHVMTYHKAKGLEWPFVILANLDADSLSDSVFYKRNYFNTRVINSREFDIHHPLRHRVIDFSFWPFGTSKTPSAELIEKLKLREDCKRTFRNVSNEESRLMYVAVTRARDILALISSTPKKLSRLQNVLPDWNVEDSVKNTQSNSLVDLFDTGSRVHFELWNQSDFGHIEHLRYPTEKKYFKKDIPQPQESPYHLRPSKQPALQECRVIEPVKIHDRLATKAKEPSELGDALHALLYLKDRKNFAQVAAQSATLPKLGISPDDFVDNTHEFNEYIQSNFQPIQSHRELYLELLHGKQLASGEADLILEQEKGLILIDYKTFPGNRDQITDPKNEFYAGKYSGQLDLYTKMAEHKLGKPVEKRLIYYVVQGVMVELK